MKRFFAVVTAVSTILIATQALANDTASRGWAGCYTGIQGGYGAGDYTRSVTRYGDIKGGFVGGTLGCNIEANSFIWGWEGDLAWASIFDVPHPNAKVNWIGSARLRTGIEASPYTLLYVTGGLGLGHNVLKSNWSGIPESNTHFGWVAGAGAEWMLGNNWTAKIEYLHYDLGAENYSYFRSGLGVRIDTVKLGVNYRFNSGLR